MFDDTQNELLIELVKLCTAQDRVDKKLAIAYNITQILQKQQLSEQMQKEVSKQSGFCQQLLTNPKFRKAVYKRSALMEREPVVYFGDEVVKGDYFDFDEELERDITEIEFRITTFLGNVMSYVQSLDIL